VGLHKVDRERHTISQVGWNFTFRARDVRRSHFKTERVVKLVRDFDD